MTKDEFQARIQSHLAPVLAALQDMNLTEPERVQDELNRSLPLSSPQIQELQSLFRQGREMGFLCYREAGGVSFSRVQKAASDGDWSIDAVHMNSPGPAHTHPNGEVDLCFPVDGMPLFDGNEPGWTVYGPQSSHAPTVSGGTMDILYFLPNGAIEFHR